MNLHHFDPVTRIYTHTTQAPASPLEEGQFLSVAFATTSQLPTIPDGHIVKRTGTSAEGDGWQLIEDNRGNVWDTTTKTQTTHTELGPLPAGLTQRQPNTFDSWNGSEWAYDVTLEIAATLPTVIAAVNAACKAGIEAGFTSDALGETHSYESELEDQLNLSGNIQRAKDVPQKCRNSLGIVDYRMHTPTQIHQVGEDLAVHKMAHLLKAKTLKDSAQAAADANDLATLQSIAW
jgi:hypothetical protein